MINLGRISISLAIIAAVVILFGFAVLFVSTGDINSDPMTYRTTGWLGLSSIAIAIVAIIVGAIARLGKEKDKLGVYSVIIGICCFLAFGLLGFVSFLKGAL